MKKEDVVYTDTFKKYLNYCNEEALVLPPEFASALVGVAHQFTKTLAVYDSAKVIEVIMERDNVTKEEAQEHFDYNIQGAYVGEHTPLFLDKIDDIIF